MAAATPPSSAGFAFPAICAQYNPPTGTHTTQLPPEPAVRREFVCGVYDVDLAPVNEGAGRPHDRDVWESLVGHQPIEKACQSIRRVLEQDVDCEGEQCRAPAGLAGQYTSRCSDHDDELNVVRRWKRTWYTHAPKAARDECYQYFLATVWSASAARDYRLQCLADREAGFLEGMILNRAIKRGGGEDTTSEGANAAEAPDASDP